MDPFEDPDGSRFVSDSDDQDSLDERIDTEQRLQNQQLWASFQNAACCIAKLYKDRSQSTVSLWNPFQNAASNLTTLYKDCIDSQRRFAKIGYQVGRKKRLREFKKLLKRHQHQAAKRQHQSHHTADTIDDHYFSETLATPDESTHGAAQATSKQQQHLQQQSNVASILAVNQLKLDCDESTSQSMQTQPSLNNQQSVTERPQPQPQPQLQKGYYHHQSQNQQANHDQLNQALNQSNVSNNEEDLVTFQQALVQPAVVRSIKSGQSRRPCLNTSGYLNIGPAQSEEDRLLELNEFLADEYHRHVGSRKRPFPHSGSPNKRMRE